MQRVRTAVVNGRVILVILYISSLIDRTPSDFWESKVDSSKHVALFKPSPHILFFVHSCSQQMHACTVQISLTSCTASGPHHLA
jgi:hypothetical protein